MTAVALFPDAELVTVTYLRAALLSRTEPYAAGVKVHTKPPDGENVDKRVRIRRVGGTQLHRAADSPRLQVQVGYDTGQPSDEKARQDLAQLVWALLRALDGGVVIVPGWGPVACYRVATFGGPANLPDPADNARTITQLTVEVGMRGRPA